MAFRARARPHARLRGVYTLPPRALLGNGGGYRAPRNTADVNTNTNEFIPRSTDYDGLTLAKTVLTSANTSSGPLRE